MSQLVEQFIDQPALLDDTSGWLNKLRAQGVDRFNSLGIPTTKNEDWKYTDLRILSKKQFSVESSNDQFDATSLGKPLGSTRLVFVGGVLNTELSALDAPENGVVVKSMRDALETESEHLKAVFEQSSGDQNNAFASLNLGLFTDGAFIEITEHCQQPIELVFVNQGDQTLTMPRSVIALGKGAQASIVEHQLSDEDARCLSNSKMHISIAQDASLDYCLVQQQGKNATHIGGLNIDLAKSSRLNMHTITLGGQMIRNELVVSLNGEGADANCNALYYGKRRQHIDNHTTIHHTAPSCTSRELYKGILDDRARGVFHGRIKVDQLAQLTASEQENPNLLLSRDAEIDTKPQLEIYADDVKCAHGATVGELDKKQLFYIQSRGIDLASARTLLTYAFAAEIVEGIEIESLREALTNQIAERMEIAL